MILLNKFKLRQPTAKAIIMTLTVKMISHLIKTTVDSVL